MSKNREYPDQYVRAGRAHFRLVQKLASQQAQAQLMKCEKKEAPVKHNIQLAHLITPEGKHYLLAILVEDHDTDVQNMKNVTSSTTAPMKSLDHTS